VAVVVGIVVTVVVGGAVGGIALRVVAGLTGGVVGSRGTGSLRFEPQPYVAASDATNTALARRIGRNRNLGVIRRGRSSRTSGTVLRVSGDSSIL